MRKFSSCLSTSTERVPDDARHRYAVVDYVDEAISVAVQSISMVRDSEEDRYS